MLRTTVLILTLATAVATVIPAAAFAEGTPEERAACRHDVTRLCRAYLHDGDDRIGSCLQANRASLSRRCSAVFAAHGR